MTHVTTHILDATSGTPASGVAVTLAPLHGTLLAEAVTDADGRLALGPERLDDGDYALTFSTGAYLRAKGVASFHPVVTVAFTVAGEQHLHVPLLLSPFAYSTYRGS